MWNSRHGRLASISCCLCGFPGLLLIARRQRLILRSTHTTNNSCKSFLQPRQQAGMLHLIIDDKPASHEVVYWAERNCNNRARETDDIVRHAEVGCRQRHKQSFRVKSHKISDIPAVFFETTNKNDYTAYLILKAYCFCNQLNTVFYDVFGDSVQ